METSSTCDSYTFIGADQEKNPYIYPQLYIVYILPTPIEGNKTGFSVKKSKQHIKKVLLKQQHSMRDDNRRLGLLR